MSVWDLIHPWQQPTMLTGDHDGTWDAGMAAKHRLINGCSQWEPVKGQHKTLPQLVQQRLPLDHAQKLVELVAEAANAIVVNLGVGV